VLNENVNKKTLTNIIVRMYAGDTASNLGNAMDELMRHQPSLRTDATKAIIKVSKYENCLKSTLTIQKEKMMDMLNLKHN